MIDSTRGGWPIRQERLVNLKFLSRRLMIVVINNLYIWNFKLIGMKVECPFLYTRIMI